jgi:MGT family glycosyltransferase
MSPRVLFTCWPFEGHVMPQLSIATVLRDRGCEVAFYTAESAHATIRSTGLEAFPFRRVDAAWVRVQARERAVGGRKQSLRVQREAFRDWLVETIPDQVEDLRTVVEEWRPDVIVTDMAMWGPIVVLWETTGIPVALSSCLMGPLTPGRDAPLAGTGLAPPRTAPARALTAAVKRLIDLGARPVRRRVDEIRADYGLEPTGCSVNEFTGRLPLHLVMGIRELDYGRNDLPPSVRYVGACVWHPAERPEAVAWLDRLPSDRPWVHVTEGTSHYQDPFVLRAAAEGLAGAPVEAILTTGSGRTVGTPRDAHGLGLAAADNIHVTDWVSHNALMPRCAAVVTTGGPGTVMASLRAGVPLVVVPTTWDKPGNARRVVDAGVGVRLAARRCTPSTLRAAVDLVLSDPGIRERAARMAELLAAAPGPSGAAESIEALARAGGPAASPAVSSLTVDGGR